MKPTFTVNVTDTIGIFASYVSVIRDNAVAAANAWGNYIVGSGQIDIQVNIIQTISNTANGGAGFYTNLGLQNFEGKMRYLAEEGTYTEITTNIDPNGALPDIIIELDPDRLNMEFGSYWFDSNPFDEIKVIPKDLVDGLFVLKHEIGHGLGINGYRDWASGSLGNFYTSFDSLVQFINGNPYFIGQSAQSVNGGPVALTVGNLYHYGNSMGAGHELVATGLMNGVVSNVGVEYNISRLDLAILKDLGYDIAFNGSMYGNIFRFFNTNTGSHFYTGSADEKDSIRKNNKEFTYEGIAFQTEATPEDGSPVYRFYNTSTDTHFYTISKLERDAVINNFSNFKFEGEAFFAYTGDALDGTGTVHRFFNLSTGTHFYTSDIVERDYVIQSMPTFRYEGVAFEFI